MSVKLRIRSSSKLLLPRMPIRSLYVAGNLLLCIIFLAIFWFIFNYAFQPVATIGSQMMQDLGTNSTRTDAVQLFFNDTLAPYILIVLFIVAGFWAFVYAQKKGVMVREA